MAAAAAGTPASPRTFASAAVAPPLRHCSGSAVSSTLTQTQHNTHRHCASPRACRTASSTVQAPAAARGRLPPQGRPRLRGRRSLVPTVCRWGGGRCRPHPSTHSCAQRVRRTVMRQIRATGPLPTRTSPRCGIQHQSGRDGESRSGGEAGGQSQQSGEVGGQQGEPQGALGTPRTKGGRARTVERGGCSSPRRSGRCRRWRRCGRKRA